MHGITSVDVYMYCTPLTVDVLKCNEQPKDMRIVPGFLNYV